MKIVQLSLSDIRGGAHRAGYRLHMALNEIGYNSNYYVYFKDTDDYTVIGPATKFKQSKNFLRYVLDSYPIILYKNKTKFSAAIIPSDTPHQVSKLNPDIIHLHWINGGMLRIEEFRKLNKKPIVWTLHDMWAFTGGCHYDNLCGKYEVSCGKCPVIKSNKPNDSSYKTLQRKRRAWDDIDLTIVTPSKWLADCAKNSVLFKGKSVEVIPYNINLELFKPWDKKFAREILGLPQDKLLILASALNIQSDPRKGFHYLSEALTKISSEKIAKDIEIIIAGSSRPQNPSHLDYTIRYLGFLNDEISMALAYSAADIFVAPSLQDNLPNTIVESLACGTPCAAFKIGGMPDMIQHQKNGYLAKPFEAEDLADGILWMLNSSDRMKELSLYSRNQAQLDYNPTKITKLYTKIYNKLV